MEGLVYPNYCTNEDTQGHIESSRQKSQYTYRTANDQVLAHARTLALEKQVGPKLELD